MKKQLFNLFLLQILGSLLGAHAIIGGNETQQGDWPFMAYVYRKPDPYSGFICGGSLINEHWVVTAGHCMQTLDPSLYGVTLGEHTRSQPSCAEQVFNITEIQRHKTYGQAFDGDIALLKLSRSAIFNHFVRPVKLVPEGFRTDKTKAPTFAGKTCTVLGWGETSSPNGTISDILLQVTKDINPTVVCYHNTNKHKEEYENRGVVFGDRKFCAGGVPGQDSCDGDSGGPLVCLHDDNLYYLHGITSYGTKICAQKDKPAVYTMVSAYRAWIDETIEK